VFGVWHSLRQSAARWLAASSPSRWRAELAVPWLH
jgi:hypothetical protein